MGLLLFIAVIAAAILALLSPQDQLIAGLQAGEFIARMSFGLLAIALAGSLIHRYRGRLGAGLRDALIWVGIFIAVVTGYAYRDMLEPVYARVMGEIDPGRIISSAPGVAEVVRRRDGHFAVDGIADGVKLSFVFDTGASTVVLRAQDAAKMGIDVERLAYSATVSTANGTTRAAEVQIATLSVGSITERNVRALVARPGALFESLLGQSFLERLASYGVENNRLALRGRAAQ